MTTLENLQAKIAKLQAQAEAITKKELSTVIAKICDLMNKHRLTLTDIASHFDGSRRGHRSTDAKSSTKSTGTAKYLDRKSGATWTGKGRAPAWIANAKDRTKFLVEGSGDHSSTATRSVAKVGNYVRGPQTPKYRDPTTGATWSGRGPAPAWLAGATDRTAFLISGESSAAQKTTTVKKAAVKKVATKKGATKGAAAAKKTPAKRAVN